MNWTYHSTSTHIHELQNTDKHYYSEKCGLTQLRKISLICHGDFLGRMHNLGISMLISKKSFSKKVRVKWKAVTKQSTKKNLKTSIKNEAGCFFFFLYISSTNLCRI